MGHDNKILITYTIEDQGFDKGVAMYVAGREDAKKGDLGTIMLPKPAKDVSIDPLLPDPVVFSYTNTEGGIIRLRVVLVKICSEAGEPSTCTVSVLVPSVDDNWVTQTADVTLDYQPSNAASPVPAIQNPHGLAQLGDSLYFIDYETHLIATIKKNVLEAAADGASLEVQTYDVAVDLEDNTVKGQAIVALGSNIFALFNSTDLATASNYDPGYLVRLAVDSQTGALTLTASTRVGLNAQSIIPVIDGAGLVQLLIPAIGGRQAYNGATNGTFSDIRVVPAAGNWSGSAQIVITGDVYTPPSSPDAKAAPTPSTATAYDIHAIGAAMRNGDSLLFILTQVYTDGAKSAFWTLYQTTVDDFLGLIRSGTPYTLSEAAGTNNDGVNFELLDKGVVQTPDPEAADNIYFWDILYEQTLRNDDEEDRLWLLLGSPFLVTKAEAYGSPSTPLANPFVMFSGFGGINVNSVDLTIETLHQAQREVSLTRGTRGAKLSASTTRASTASTAATGGVAEEEEDK
jgi:hypothetical protein